MHIAYPLLDPLLWLIWCAWGTQAVLSVLVVRKFARRFEKFRRPQHDTYRPRVAVIVPFKGRDAQLEANLQSLCAQDYPDYQLIGVVESTDDPAYGVLRAAARRHESPRIEVLTAGPAAPAQGQKTHNQLAAIAHLQAQTNGEAVWVFADSDIEAPPHWLARLVGPLGESPTGLTTGYRWLVPTARAGARRPSVWAVLGSVMNATVACFCGRDAFNHAWGGSMALRVETARAGAIQTVLRGAINDDYPLTDMVRDLGLRIYYVSACTVASPVTFTFRELANFAHRQWFLTRVHAPRLLAIALALHTLFVVGFFSAWGRVALAARHGTVHWWPAALAMAVVFGAHQARHGWRRRAARHVFGDAMDRRLGAALRADRWLTPVWMTCHWLLMGRALLGRSMRWRGVRYVVRGPNAVRRVEE